MLHGGQLLVGHPDVYMYMFIIYNLYSCDCTTHTVKRGPLRFHLPLREKRLVFMYVCIYI